MKSWRSRIAVGLAVGAAAVTIPLTVGSASAFAADWQVAGGGFRSEAACVTDGEDYVSQPENDFSEFKCVQDGDTWTMWVR